MNTAIPVTAFFFSMGLATTGLSESREILSKIYSIDKEYRSMEGPESQETVYLTQTQPPELLWITGLRTDMVGPDGVTPSLPEFMCHVNLDYDSGKHGQIFGWKKSTTTRLLTLSQGQVSATFPEGFGLPVMSDEGLALETQVLNLNLEKPNFQVRHKVAFDFVRDKDLKRPLKPLFNTGVFSMTLLEGSSGRFGQSQEASHGESCLPGMEAPNTRGRYQYHDRLSQKFTGHWVVKPGREVNHTSVTQFMNLPFDTTIHYIAVHLHPYAESLELRDLTAGKTLFKSHARGFKDKIGLSHVDAFSSQKGIPVFKDHEYELVSIYNNTTNENQDSMAVMLLFALDKEFKKPEPVAAIPASISLLP